MKKGAILAGRKGPTLWLRNGLSQDVKERGTGGRCLAYSIELPYGNFVALRQRHQRLVLFWEPPFAVAITRS
jgi:hypothetical protein